MTYTYECSAGVEFDIDQKITDPKLTTCPLCSNCVPKRLIAGTPKFNLVAGESGGWSDTGYSQPLAVRKAEKVLGKKVNKRQ